jgi:hypothetical protein
MYAGNDLKEEIIPFSKKPLKNKCKTIHPDMFLK